MSEETAHSRRPTWLMALLFVITIAAVCFGWWWFRTPSSAPAAGPVNRPSNEPATEKEPEHPLDPALEMAREGLARIQDEVRDYTATLTKRERISGSIVEQKMKLKFRQRKRQGDDLQIPMSVYLEFLEPASVAGREVIWVEQQNDGKLIAHEGGFKNLLRVHLPPTGLLAMMGNRYPIYDIGIENLIDKLIERGERDKKLGDCQVEFLEAKLGDRVCQVIQVTHPEKVPPFDFFQARIYIDKELNVPLKYSAYLWPESPGGEPILDEEYIYENMKLNAGLTDKDFDPDNEDYEYPGSG